MEKNAIVTYTATGEWWTTEVHNAAIFTTLDMYVFVVNDPMEACPCGGTEC